jgi:hypothetical protein
MFSPELSDEGLSSTQYDEDSDDDVYHDAEDSTSDTGKKLRPRRSWTEVYCVTYLSESYTITDVRDCPRDGTSRGRRKAYCGRAARNRARHRRSRTFFFGRVNEDEPDFHVGGRTEIKDDLTVFETNVTDLDGRR